MHSSLGSARPYFRTPRVSPDGQQAVFVYAGSIWRVDIRGGKAERLTANSSRNTWPCWSPDGARLAFSSNRAGTGDIYTMPLPGTPASQPAALERITYYESDAVAETWSPDGTQLFFRSSREQLGAAIYRAGATGGTPIAWIGQPHEDIHHPAIAPDGATLAFNLVRDRWWRRGPNPYGGAEIWLASNIAQASDFRKLSDAPGLNRWPMWAPDGQGLFFVSDRDGIENIWYQPLEGAARQVTSFREGRLLWPSISADGATIVFERDFALWRLALASGVAEPITIEVGGDTPIMPARVIAYRDQLTELELAPDGKKLAFVVRGEIFADFADKETDKEQRNGPAFRVTNNSFRDSDASWSPDSRKLAYTSDRFGDEEIFSYDFASRAEARLTNSERIPGPKHTPCYSPDGAWLAYGCGEDEIRLLNTSTSEDRLLARAPFMYRAQLAWSPDSQWLAFIAEDQHWFRNLYVQRVDEAQPRQITFLSTRNAQSPIWSPDGRFIVFSEEGHVARVDLRPPTPFFRESEFEKLFDQKEAKTEAKEPAPEPAGGPAERARPEEPATADEEPAPPAAIPAPAEPAAPPAKPKGAELAVAIVFEGIERRIRYITPLSLPSYALCISPDSRDLIFNAFVAGKQNLWTIPLDEPRQEQAPRQLTTNGGAKSMAHFAPDGKSIYFLDNGQILVRKFPHGEPTSLPVLAEMSYDFNQEKRQMFEECWRRLRDYFYDPTFRGLDWSAAREQFAPLAAGAQTHDELIDIVNLMAGELRASHLGAYPAGGGSSHGYLGLLFDSAEQAASGRLVVAEVVADSPAALAGVAVGEELTAVNGELIAPERSLGSLLERTVGRRVLLRVGARELAVRPIGAGAYRALRYRAWVYANEAYVHRVSGGRLGYVHIRAMDDESLRQFLMDLDSEAYTKEGIVVDVRFNTGGSTANFIIDILARRGVLLRTFRNRPPIDSSYYHGTRGLNRPTVLVINERSVSNAEVFAESYRRLGLGSIVGRPTAGAVIGTNGYQLIDGTSFRLPQIKASTLEGEDLEGVGRMADIDVALPLGEWARGIDRQLDAAVQTLLGQIDRARQEL